MRRRRKSVGCVCGSGDAYRICCGRYLDTSTAPPTAAELMRSRYTAYAKGNVGYIIETTDPQGPVWNDDTSAWRRSIRDFHRSCSFDGVEVLEHTEDSDGATVRFHARITRDGEDASFVETSTFVRRDGKWLYSAAEIDADH